VEDLSAKSWPAWRVFLQEYAHDCRSRPLLERLTLVAPLAGAAGCRPPDEDVALAVRHWAGVVEPLDQLLFVYHLLRLRPMPRLQRDVFAAVIAGLALWDPAVSRTLVELPFAEVLAPAEVLAALARERGWAVLPGEATIGWQEGMVDQFAGAERTHSSALAELDRARGADELQRRIWSAQVGVLLPYVEGRRRELLEGLGGQLTGPFHFDSGLVVSDIRDLEIGQIEYQLTASGRRVPRVVRLLKEIRNRLAHLEVVGADLLDPSELLRPL
jgi:hypothetical protein